MADAMNEMDTHQYSTTSWVRASFEREKTCSPWMIGYDTEGQLFLFLVFVDTLKLFAGFEAHRFSWGNVDFLAGAGIAADTGLARLNAKDAEAAEFDALAATKSLLERFEDCFDGLLGFGAADVRRDDDGIYDIQLNHANPPTLPRQMLEGAAQVVKT